MPPEGIDLNLEKLWRLVQRINSACHLGDLIGVIAEGVSEYVQAEACHIYLYDAQWKELYLRRQGEGIRFPLGRGIAGTIAECGETLLVPAVCREPLYLEEVDNPSGLSNVVDIISAALRDAQGSLIGVVQAVNSLGHGFTEADETFLGLLSGQAGAAIGRTRRTESYHDFVLSLMHSVASGIDNRRLATLGHTNRVHAMAMRLAKILACSDLEMEQVRLASLLHDLGRIEGDGEVMEAPAKMTARLREHILYTEAILKNIRFPEHLRPVVDLVMHMHERLDGGGYPKGLTSRDLGQLSSILPVVNTYDALTSQSRHGRVLTCKEALTFLREGSGVLFHKAVVDAFLDRKVYEIDKRKHQRFPYQVPLDVGMLGSGDDKFQARESEAVDLSEGGLCFRWHEGIPQYTPLHLTLHLPTQAVHAIAKVARNITQQDGTHLVGVYFLWHDSF